MADILIKLYVMFLSQKQISYQSVAVIRETCVTNSVGEVYDECVNQFVETKTRYNVECHGIVLQSQVTCAQKACYNSFMKCKKQLVDIEPQVRKKKFLTQSWNNLAVNFYPETGCL